RQCRISEKEHLSPSYPLDQSYQLSGAKSAISHPFGKTRRSSPTLRTRLSSGQSRRACDPPPMKSAVLTCALVATATLAHAELPPTAYIGQQAKAPEALRIRVTEVDSRRASWSGSGFTWKETVKAEVTAVTRSASGLKPGEHIVITYSRL